MKKFVIVALMPSVVKGHSREVVQEFNEGYERAARLRYKELLRSYPLTYFELLSVEHTEICLDFTKDRSPLLDGEKKGT